MGLAIDGNVVHGIARGGQAFLSLENVNNADGSINIDGQDYFSKNKIKVKSICNFSMNLNVVNAPNSVRTDITNDLLNYAGYLAICLASPSGHNSGISQPFIIPTAPTTVKLSFQPDVLSTSIIDSTTSLSRTTDNKFIFYCNANEVYLDGDIFILSNEAS